MRQRTVLTRCSFTALFFIRLSNHSCLALLSEPRAIWSQRPRPVALQGRFSRRLSAIVDAAAPSSTGKTTLAGQSWASSTHRLDADSIAAAGATPSPFEAGLSWRIRNCWEPSPEAPLAVVENKTVAIVGFSFGQGLDGTPGGTNMALAWQAHRLRKARPDVPLILQWEIADAMNETYGVLADLVVRPKPGIYLDTTDVAVAAYHELVRRGLGGVPVALVAHPDHALRCSLSLLQLGVKSLWAPMRGAPIVDLGVDEYFYDNMSTQPWTRSREVYRAHELAVRPKAEASGVLSFEDVDDSCEVVVT